MASIIDPTVAKSLIKEFQQQNASSNGPAIKTSDGQYLNGFFIDRESLDAILSNKNFVGLSVYLAKHPDFLGNPENIFTLIFAGAEPNNEPGAKTAYVNNGDVYDQLPPCPPYCGSLQS
jgi:hypothetical protein